MSRIIVVGAGIYGVTAARELRQRGHHVQLLDPGPLPHPLAASTDISKAIRLDYGADEEYTALMEVALAKWREWNAQTPIPLFHETGMLFACGPMQSGGLEYESYQLLTRRGHRLERLTSADLARRFPAWNADLYAEGYFNPQGGYAQSGKVVAWLVERAQAAGVELHAGQTFARFIESKHRVSGIITREGTQFEGDAVVIAAGSWTPHILPELAGVFRSNGMPVFHLRPHNPDEFRAEVFPLFSADVSNTGYYGFPLHPENGIVKIANHGPGRHLHPESPERHITETEIAHLQKFLAGTFPALAEAAIVYTRICLYCDTWDGHFWIARDPEREGVVVSAGGSGHGFKFAPFLGQWAADAVEGKPNPALHKFRWRPDVRPARSEEATRHQADSK